MGWSSDLGKNSVARAVACSAVVRQRLQSFLAIDRSDIDPALTQQSGFRHPTHHVESLQDRVDVATERDGVGPFGPTLLHIQAFNQIIKRDNWGDFRCKVWPSTGHPCMLSLKGLSI